MSHMITASGAEYHFTGPPCPHLRPVRIEDIAHHLALLNRFHGATTRPYSVAEHSLLVCQLAAEAGYTPMVQLAALLHDGHEAYTNDLASPAKQAIDVATMPVGVLAWRQFEAEHALHMRKHFGITTIYNAWRAPLRHLDLVALATERRDLTAWRAEVHAPWPILNDGQHNAIVPSQNIYLMTAPRQIETWHGWRANFLQQFYTLKDTIEQMTEALLHDPANQPGGASA